MGKFLGPGYYFENLFSKIKSFKTIYLKYNV